MKQIEVKMTGVLWLMCIILMAACNQESIDKDIKKQLAIKAKTEINFAGLQYTVAKGVILLAGKCPTENAREDILKQVKGIAGVKDIVNQIQVASVVIGTDYTLKSAIDSILADYPLAIAEVQDSSVTLRGQVNGKQLQNLLTGVEKLHPKQVNNLLLVQEGS